MDIHGKKEQFCYADNPIKELWNHRGSLNKEDLPDQNQKKLELSFILKNIEKDFNVLDLGCGNGKVTFEIAKIAKMVQGVDISETIIEKAKLLATDNLSFSIGDVTDLKYEDNSYDFVLSERCLINLESYERQLCAISEIHRVLKKGGIYLMLETSKQGIESVRKYRKQFNLKETTVPWHNQPIDEEKLIKDIEGIFSIQEKVYLGMYFFISRILHPLLVAPHKPKFDDKINQIALEIAKKIPNINNEMSQIVMCIFQAI